MEELLRFGNDPGDAAMYRAAATGDVRALDRFVRDGRDVGASVRYHRRWADMTESPLHAAARRGHAGCVAALLRAGGRADVGTAASREREGEREREKERARRAATGPGRSGTARASRRSGWRRSGAARRRCAHSWTEAVTRRAVIPAQPEGSACPCLPESE